MKQNLNSDNKSPASTGFSKIMRSNPCQGCAAYCCQMLLIPYKTPETFMDLDYIKYMLGFPDVGMILYPDGSWQVQIKKNCSNLDKNNKCELHGSDEKPKTCTSFNPHGCFYKSNFSDQKNGNIIQLNAKSFRVLIDRIGFDEMEVINSIPSQEEIKLIVQEFGK